MAGAGRASAQVFLAARPNPEFTIGPLFVRATVTPALGPVPVDVLFSVVVRTLQLTVGYYYRLGR